MGISPMNRRKRRRSPFLFTREAAEYLRLAYQTLVNWRSNQEGPDWTKHGRRVVYTTRDLNRWSNGRRRRRK